MRIPVIFALFLLSISGVGCCKTCPGGRDPAPLKTDRAATRDFITQVADEMKGNQPASGYHLTKLALLLNDFDIPTPPRDRPIDPNQLLYTTALANPATAGLLLGGLNSLLNDVNTMLNDIPQEFKALVVDLQQSLQRVIADVNRVLGDKLKYTFDRLQGVEREMFANAESMLEQSERAVRLLTDRALKQATIAVKEANILQYDASNMLPCRNHNPRMLYCDPEEVRYLKDRLEVAVRGNFLDYGPDVQVTVAGKPVQVIRTSNEYRLKLPAELFTDLTEQTTVSVKASPYACTTSIWGHKVVRGKELEVPLVLTPAETHSVAVKIQPTVKIRVNRSFDFNYDRIDDDCKADYDVAQTYPLPEPFEYTGCEMLFKGGWAGWRVDGCTDSGAFAVKVTGHLKGGGKYLKFIGCKSRGRVSWTVRAHGRTYEPQLQSLFEATANGDSSNPPPPFEYNHPIPGDNRGVDWNYSAVVVVKVGNQITTYYLDRTDRTSEDGKVSLVFDDGAGRLIVRINSDARLASPDEVRALVKGN